MKRDAPSDDAHDQERPAKRTRIVHHEIKYKQALAQDCMSGMQDETFFQSQLLRAITLSLATAGYDSVQPTALEAFRAETEAYMLRFLNIVRSSMNGSRRSTPTPHDFATALAQTGVSPSALLQSMKIPSIPSITQPPIPPILEPESKAPDLQPLLGPELSSAPETRNRKFLPKHLPELPSRHTWQATPVFPKREEDARKIRERATQEGVMAEQALRRLMAASMSGAKGKEIQGRGTNGAGNKSKMVWNAALAAIQARDNAEREKEEKANWEGEDTEMDAPVGATKTKVSSNVSFDSTMIVNYDRKYWRQASRGRA